MTMHSSRFYHRLSTFLPKVCLAALSITILLLKPSLTQAQVLHLGMTKKEIVDSFPRGALTNEDKIDTSYQNEGSLYFGNKLTNSILGFKGQATLYFDTTYHLIAYEWRTLKKNHPLETVMRDINKLLIKRSDSIGLDTSSHDYPYCINYYKNKRLLASLCKNELSIKYFEGKIIFYAKEVITPH